MALPHNKITPLPNTEPEAVPDLWNTRYLEIDNNFKNLDGRTTGNEQELTQARGGKTSLKAALDEISGRVGTTEPDYQEALHFEVRRQMEMSALAFAEQRKTLGMRIQQGEVVLQNRGVQQGMAVTKSTTATRNLNIAKGRFFLGGRLHTMPARENDAVVPANTSAQTMTCTAYVWLNGNRPEFDVTPLGQDVPAGAVALYRLTVPAYSAEGSDPQLAQVTLTDIRRLEPDYPVMLDSPAQHMVALVAQLPVSDWQLSLDVVGSAGGMVAPHQVQVSARASNGFRLTLAHFADDVRIRYTLTKTGV